ncbi:hypothetical protein CERSUDRAFT_60152 [Gelatoporia subvermispora B]|uniref:Major facilitator superfamily (MFS) profile domain-containing protein n=1 Tax=Ceriporiopsis subvermispora (strain B) TaxID=914234 RepID=M2QGU9_CERS8|nr:hypothetical protein CERSUDRAFT_60152 [Gelatoporia subvermispora B]
MSTDDLRRIFSDNVERAQSAYNGANSDKKMMTPLPTLQLFILLYLQLAEPLTSTVVYPFVNQLVRETGVTGGDERKTGYYAGLIESSFYATEAICVLQWGRLSDKFGRKPILLSGLVDLIISIVCFGLSKSYWALILSRCAEGALNGNIGVTKSMMTEITDLTNRAQGFAYMPMIWSLGSTLGPVIGGVFAEPTKRWPSIFGKTRFWAEYPYFLPCVTIASISTSAFLITLLCLKERLPASDPERSSIADSDKQINISEHIELGSLQDSHAFNPDNEEAQVLQERKTSKATEDEITFRSILIPRVLLPVINYGFLAFTDQAVQVLIPLMYSSQIDYGGLGFDPFAIGLIQGAAGFVIGLLQILTFPALLRRFGPKKLYIASYASYLLVCCAFPLLAHITNKAGAVNAWSWTIIVLQLAAYAMSCPAWGCIFMYISESAPSSATLGLTNGLAQTTASVMRAIAPSTSSSLFSASLEHNLAGGHMVYWFLCIFTIFGLLAASQLRPHVG